MLVCLWTAGPSLLFTSHICMIVTSGIFQCVLIAGLQNTCYNETQLVCSVGLCVPVCKGIEVVGFLRRLRRCPSTCVNCLVCCKSFAGAPGLVCSTAVPAVFLSTVRCTRHE